MAARNNNYEFKNSQLFIEHKFVFISNLTFVEHLEYSFCCPLDYALRSSGTILTTLATPFC